SGVRLSQEFWADKATGASEGCKPLQTSPVAAPIQRGLPVIHGTSFIVGLTSQSTQSHDSDRVLTSNECITVCKIKKRGAGTKRSKGC
ncbi:hypothetical protein LSH36_488g02047, partial [Paralvinella palmiformis]